MSRKWNPKEPLTEQQQEWMKEWVEKWPDPPRMLKGRYQHTLTKLFGLGWSWEDLVSEGHWSALRATSSFIPETLNHLGKPMKFVSYAYSNCMTTYRNLPIRGHIARDLTRRRECGYFCESDLAAWSGDEGHETTPIRLAVEHRPEGAELLQEETFDQLLRRLDRFRLLTENERTVLSLRYNLPVGETMRTSGRTLKYIGDRMGLSKERVRQVETKALRKLREAVEETGLV